MDLSKPLPPTPLLTRLSSRTRSLRQHVLRKQFFEAHRREFLLNIPSQCMNSKYVVREIALPAERRRPGACPIGTAFNFPLGDPLTLDTLINAVERWGFL